MIEYLISYVMWKTWYHSDTLSFNVGRKKTFLTKRMCFLFTCSSFWCHKIDNSTARVSIKVNNIHRPVLITVIADSWKSAARERGVATERVREKWRGQEREWEILAETRAYIQNPSVDHSKYKWYMQIPYIEWFDYCLNYNCLDATSTMSRWSVQFWFQSFIRLIHLLVNHSIYAAWSFFSTFE